MLVVIDGEVLVRPKSEQNVQMKTTPRQARARETIESILDATGDLLEEVGFERLSTNMVCKKANLTPPALYRYFPNKYALLKELADRLVDEHDRATAEWMENGGLEAENLDEIVQKNMAVQRTIVKITQNVRGGLWISRALRSVPSLIDIRLKKRDMIAQRVFDGLSVKYPFIPDDKLKMATIMSTGLTIDAAEMVIEEKEIDPDTILREASTIIGLYYIHLVETYARKARDLEQ